MTIVTRYPTALSGAVVPLPLMAWETGLAVNRRWVPGRLPASGSIANWVSNEGALLAQGSVAPTVGTEGGVKHALFSGADQCQLNISGLTEADLRTIVVIARPNTGDTFFTSSGNAPIFSTNSLIVSQGVNADVAALGGASVGSSLTALRDRWHMYAVSIPAPSGTGVLVVDNSDTTFPASATSQNALRLARSSTANFRQLRVLEVFTSGTAYNATQLKAMYAKVKAWYPNLTWG